MQRWEYLTELQQDPNRFAQLGRDGWELVSVSVYTRGRDVIKHFYFKRPLNLGNFPGEHS